MGIKKVGKNIFRYGNLFSIVMALFLFDVILLGSGAWSNNILGINIRKILYIFLYLMAFFSFLKNGISENLLWLVIIATGFSFLFALLIPILTSGTIESAMADWMPLIGLMFVPIIAGLEHHHKFWSRLRVWVQILCLFLAIIHIVIWSSGMYSLNYLEIFKVFMNTYLRSQAEGAIDNIIIAETPDGGVRILYPSSLLLIIGLYFSMSEFVSSPKKWRAIIKLLIFWLALYTTWTRAFYILPIIAMILYVLYDFVLNKNSRFQSIYFYYLLIIVFLLIFQIFLVMSSEILKILGLASVESDGARIEQIYSITDVIVSNPIFGIGLGGHADLIRSAAAPWTYEMAFFALLMKVGVVGVLLVFLMLWFGLKASNISISLRSNLNLVINWLAFSTASMFIFGSNPFLFSLAGVGVALIIFMDLVWISENKK